MFYWNDNRLMDMKREIQHMTEECREDMHEPDEAGVDAKVFNPNGSFDNAMGDDPINGEIIVRLTNAENEILDINLADLIAIARATNHQFCE